MECKVLILHFVREILVNFEQPEVGRASNLTGFRNYYLLETYLHSQLYAVVSLPECKTIII